MTKRVFGWMIGTAAVVACAVLAVPAIAQQCSEHLAWPLTPRSWNPPRTADGKPDLQGVWNARRRGTPSHSVEDGVDPFDAVVLERDQTCMYGNVLASPACGRIPYQPWAAAKREENQRNIFTPTKWSQLDTDDRCLPTGVPRANYYREFRVVQEPGYVNFLYQYTHAYRVVPTDGRPPLGKSIRLWMGDSRGRWEGDTLVIDVTNRNDKTWFDSHGSFHSENLRVTERWTLADPDTLFYEATMDDPTVFTGPWTIALTYDRDKGSGVDLEIWEDSCTEGVRNELALSSGRLLKGRGETGIHRHPLNEKKHPAHTGLPDVAILGPGCR